MSEKLKNEGARLTLYRDAPEWDGQAAFAVGQFACETPEAGAALLEKVADLARNEGATALVGPMDGDTWHSYRLVTETDDSKPFLMEPGGKAHDRTAFEVADFAPISGYFSASVPLGVGASETLPEADGLRVESWGGSDPERLFAQVHALSCEAFAGNPFYKPIDLPDFLAMYMPVVPMLKRELILFARAEDDSLTGFLFGIPNYAEGLQPQSVILKTYASLRKGAGHALSARFYHTAKALGYQTAIHALMHDDNLSAMRSGMNGATVFRRYALMGRRLD